MPDKFMQSNILKTGTKFRVTDRTTDTTFPPGTLGYMAAIKGSDRDYSNVMFMYAAIIRRGKTGKERVEMASLSIPIFDIESDKLKDKMPDEKRRNYVHIEPINTGRKTVHDMPTMDYLGWAYANSYYLKLLANKATRVKVWVDDPENDHVAHMYRAREYFELDRDNFIESACNSPAKLGFVNRARKMEAALVKCTLPYKKKAAELERMALLFLESSGVKNSLIKDTKALCMQKLSLLSRTMAVKGKLKMEG